MPRVLITGAAGFIGMHTSIRFLREGWDVVGLDNMNNYYSVGLKRDRLKEIEGEATKLVRNFKMFEADLNSDVWNELKPYEFEAVIHLAAQAGVRYSLENPLAYLESNILGFQKVLDFVKSQRIERFLYASSSSVYGKDSDQPFDENQNCNNPESYYAATKKANELMARSFWNTFKVPSIGLRFFTVYGPFGRPDMAPMLFADAARKGNVIKVFNEGNQKRDFTYIDDIIEGVFKLIDLRHIPQDALVINIGNGSPVELMDFINLIEKSMGIPLDKEFVEAQKGDVMVTYASTKKLKELTGYQPKVSLNKGIKIFIEWFKAYNND